MSAQARQTLPVSTLSKLTFRPGRSLFVVSAVMLAVLLYWAVEQLLNPMNVPVSKIRVQGSFINVTENMLKPLSKQVSGVGYFDINVDAIQQQVENLPWIEQATVRRIWPETLAIHFIERQPFAVWSQGGLLSTRGEIFRPAQSTYPSGLPVFHGPEKLREKMLKSYQQFSRLLAPLDMQISELKLDRRHAWQIDLHSGMRLKLG
ncbi:MAG: cell division protein FtsQ/DivIB, partial [Pseudomonadota bacterium]